LVGGEMARHFQFRTRHELWHKENLINLGIARLPEDWEYVAWIDADIQFTRPDWVQETLHQLQHYDVIQLWSHAQDLGPRHEPMDRHASFCYCHSEFSDLPKPDENLLAARRAGRYYSAPAIQVASPTPTFPNANIYNWHPGFAWAARRNAIEDLGGLIDWAPLGAGDRHRAKALVGRVTEATAKGLSPRYYELLGRWQDRAKRYIRRNIGRYLRPKIHTSERRRIQTTLNKGA
jgi:glycosyltransferase involved in cell wall biosynthesis